MNGKISLWILGAILSLTLAPFFLTNIACAEEITIDEIYHFRSIHSPNSVNYVIGDRLLFGAEIIPSGGTNVTASQDSFLDLPLFFIPSANKPNSQHSCSLYSRCGGCGSNAFCKERVAFGQRHDANFQLDSSGRRHSSYGHHQNI